MMSNTPTTVLLITSDEQLRSLAEQFRPTGSRLKCLVVKEVTAARLADADEVWLDLDAGPDVLGLAGIRCVCFHTLPRPTHEVLPQGRLIPKPCHPSVFQALWACVMAENGDACRQPAKQAGSLPRWLLDYQELDLKVLCRKCVTILPAQLGYRVASFYVHDPQHGMLRLADTTHARPIDSTIPLDARDRYLLAAVVESGRFFRTNHVSAELASRGLPQYADRPYEDTVCLVAPLMSNGSVWGALTFTSRAPAAVAPELPLEGIFDFLGRAVHHACEFERAQREARVDGLTGLYNQRWMMEALEKEIRRAQRFASPLSVLMLDLDGLKAVNDRAGHAAGDCLLRHVASRIAAVLRQFDGAARVGGDEFVVMLPATSLRGARHVASRLLESIRDHAAQFGQRALPITASIGAVEWRDGWDAHQLIDAADRAMYRAKANGRDKLVCQADRRPATIRMGAATPATDRPAAQPCAVSRPRTPPQPPPETGVRAVPRRGRLGVGRPDGPARQRGAT